MSCSYMKMASKLMEGKSGGIIPPPLGGLIGLQQAPINWGYLILGLAIWIGVFLLSAWILQLIWNGIVVDMFRAGSVLKISFVQALAIRFGLGLLF